jgi:tRNA modification GTPase
MQAGASSYMDDALSCVSPVPSLRDQHMQLDTDTIVAISTPPGRGGIGIVRLSGPEARAIAEPLLRLRDGMAAGRARFAEIVDEQGRVLDEAVVTYFVAPHSYTAEDVVEIACHGSPVLLDYLVRASLGRGARLAEPGEFTQRAFLSGRLDLTQAEAVNDLIAAQTLQQARVAAAQLGGAVARAIAPVKQRLIALIAELEAGIDFAEDDLDLMPEAAIVAAIEAIRAELRALAATYGYGRIVREGFTLAIVGRPNAGKSSLFNRLLERERAIVTAQPGTTRDPISERLAIGGVPVELVDTAGLRDAPEGEAETLGIERTRVAMADADFVVLVVDAAALDGDALGAEDRETLASLAGRPHQVVLNKCDLLEVRNSANAPAIYTSAKTGEGLEELKAAILAALSGTAPAADSAMITNLRQHEALAEAVAAMDAAHSAATSSLPHEMVLMDLHAGLEALDRLTGATTTEDILGLIFSTFCIGK